MHFALLLFLSLQGVSADAAQHMEAGVAAHRQGNVEAAITEFRAASQADPNLPEAFLNLGEEYVQTHRYADALAPLKRALELRPDMDAAHLQIGYALLSLGFAADAIPHLERVRAIEALGIAQIETGRFDQAVINLNAALAEHPNDQDLLYYLGRASGLLSKRSIDTLMAAFPESARSHQAMAENYFVLRQMPQAEEEFRAALSQRPDIPGLQLELGMVYAGAAQWTKAEEAFRAETKLEPGKAEAHYRLGSALLQQGKVAEARAELEQANRLRPDMPETLYSAAKAASLAGDSAGAERYWSRQLQVEAHSALAAQAHFGLAGIYRKQGDTARARAEMQEFQKLQNASGTEAATAK